MNESRNTDQTIPYYSLFKDELFEELEIPCPKTPENPQDYPQLLQHLVSVYRVPLNNYYRRYGLDARTGLLTRIVMLLDEMPELQPRNLREGAVNMEAVYEAVAGLLSGMPYGERKAG